MSPVHVNRDGTSYGPYPEDHALALYAQGRIAATDLVWQQGMAEWRPAAEVLGSRADGLTAAAPPFPLQGELGERAGQPGVQAGDVPPPPSLHWGLMVLFTLLSFGIFFLVWIFRQSTWVKRIDPRSHATAQLAVYTVFALLGQYLTDEARPAGVQALGMVLIIAAFVLVLMGVFSMRQSMLDHYNTVEPIGLKLSAAMTVLFGNFYLQYHMRRIARWKKTGVLPPQ